jgi:acid phosphatase type 7
MDAGRFDALTKALGHRLLRRRLLGNIMGGTLSLLGLRDAEIATARKTLAKCKKVKDKKRQKKCIRQVKDRRRHGTDQPRPGSTDSTTLPQCPGGDCSNVLLAAGDVASCASSGDEATAALLDRLGGTIVALGDNVYDSGTSQEFATCYTPSWGRHKSRTRPAVGNHEHGTAGAAGYFGYFGGAAGDPSKGYYSYDLGSWHIVVINSNCAQVGGCGAGSPQEVWLRADLAAHPATCTLAYWHHPRFSSSRGHGNNPEMAPIWQALYEHGADVVLSGHDHTYERFSPQDSAGNLDRDRGIRQFVVGTGGRSHYEFGTVLPQSEVRNGDTFGVLQLTLHLSGYDWQFFPETGKTFTDAGSGTCH